MKLRKRSIISHTFVTIGVMLFVFCVMMGFLIYNRSKSTLTKQIMRNALDVAETCAAYLDAEAFSRIDVGDEGSEDYEKVLDALALFRDHTNVEYIYTIKYNDNKMPIFSVDSDPEKPAAIGDKYVYNNATFTALNGTAAADSKPVTDEWGMHLIAFAPIKLENTTIGAVGVDLDYHWVQREYRKFLYLIMTISAIFFIVGFFVLQNGSSLMKKELRALDVKIDGLRHDAPNMMMSKDLRQGDEFEYLADHINDIFSENRKQREKDKMKLRVYEEEAHRNDVLKHPGDVMKDLQPVESKQEVAAAQIAAPQKTAPETPESELQKAYADTKVLQYAEAKRYLEDEELIRVTLREFYDGIRENADEIERFLAEGDYDNYTIKVHALKSSARMIGAGTLSEHARILESLGNRLCHEEAG